MKGLNDISLVTQVALFHNKRAFDSLVMKYQEPVRRFFLNLTLGDRSLSDDLAQETFIKAYMNIFNFRGVSSFSTWLFRIAYNVFYDNRRHLHPMDNIDTTSCVAHVTTSAEGRSSENLKMDIYTALEILKSPERTCITLQLMEGETVEHIASITGMNINTVKSHLMRAKDKLSTYLKNNGYER